ncbi:poly [ADP-ribose] polymerase 4 isoform X2 [Seriola lalandi dorsalis]|uniref:poly [ADP-ribose] polymerase 4 isoform X2 n=1 Tax=Seriola lalandi dorsalis TaxID=1841481 RepID=UPI000C6FBA74|nr:poly [ADP-ribose] polymerase 4 isoform X2 [Seriola lalandi dorsalis]
MALFENCSLLLDLKTLPFKEKKRLKSAVTENGGNISFVVNKQCSLIVTSDVSNLSSNRLRSIQKYETPVVGVEYVYSCLDRGALLPVDGYKLETSAPSDFSTPPLVLPSPRSTPLSQASKAPTSTAVAEQPKEPAESMDSVSRTQRTETPEKSGNILEKFRIYTETDSDLPSYPDNFQVAKYSVFEKINSNTWCVLELQSVKGEKGRLYRVVRYWKNNTGAKKEAMKDMLVFLSTSEEALEMYQALRETFKTTGLQLRSSIPPQARDLGSSPLQQLLLEEKLNTGSLSQEVAVFVEMLWTEAVGLLSNILRVSVNKLSLNDVTRAEGLLLQAQRKLKEENPTEVVSLLAEFYTLLPHWMPQLSPDAKLISQKLDLCQLIRDLLNVSEMTLRSPAPSCLGNYRALRCSIETVPSSSSEFQAVTALLRDSKVQIQQVLRVSRGVELQTFKGELGNIKPLLHSSSPSNFVGILSRGLLLPRVGVEHHGIERTDTGNLGSGIYFTDAISTSLKYSKCSVTDGSRLLLVCDVALGSCKDVHKRDLTLTEAPEGHHSVHGIRRSRNTHSEFEDDEYVVYSPDQVKLKYVVQFSIEGDQLKEFSPTINNSAEPCLPPSDQTPSLDLDDGVEKIKNPLEDVTAGLLDSSGEQLPLQAVHVKCKLMDLLSQVIIFQKYTNTSSVPIEAKYVFPLDDSAAVCGFEAFINGKHVVGKVKEKEAARKEYKQAIEKGHGAYLMDQDAPDVFTISVGNLPPGATVLIKVTFVSELIIRRGGILFSLPGSVAPWQESAALNQTTQVTVEKVCVTDKAASTREFTLDVSIEMPYEIDTVYCLTHKVKMKSTQCKAVVSVLPGEVMGAEGFQLTVTLSEIHRPRMWVETHPDKDSQACMLVFYPYFDIESMFVPDEVVLLLDTSESMKGESLHMAQRIALQVLKTLGLHLRLNVILFGTDHTEAFLTAQPLAEFHQAAENFIKRLSPVGGSTELWRPLRALSLLPPSVGTRNLLLLSDGHIQNAELTLQLLRDNAQHSRLFTCGLSPTANRHMLRALAQAGGGVYEFFDTKTKHNWAEKVASQVKRIASPGCSSVSVKWQQFNPRAPTPVQAPKQLHALFSNCHTLVYGFVPHCTQATLLGNLSGQELKTIVSTSELQKTRGTFLHKLTARALIRDYEDGNLDTNEAEHEGKKEELKSFILELSKEFSILSQFTSFVAIEERDSEKPEEGFTDIPKLIAEEDVDFLRYISWTLPQESSEEEIEDEEEYSERTHSMGPIKCDMALSSSSDDSLMKETLLTSGVLHSLEHSGSSDESSQIEFSSPIVGHQEAADYREANSMRSSVLLRGLEFLPDCTIVKGRRPSHPALPPPPPPPPPPPLAQAQVFGSLVLPPPHPLGFIGSQVKSRSHKMSYRALDMPLPLTSSANTCDSFDRSFSCSQPRQRRTSPKMTEKSRRRIPMTSKPTQSPPLILDMKNECPVIKPQDLSFTGAEVGDELSATLLCHSRRRVKGIETDSMEIMADTAEPAPLVHVQEPVRKRMNRSQISDEFLGTSGYSPPQVGLQRRNLFEARAAEGLSLPPLSPMTKGIKAASGSPPVKLAASESAFAQFFSEASKRPPRLRAASVVRFFGKISAPQTLSRKSPRFNWTKIFQMQHSEGYWELTNQLGEVINVNVDLFANKYLKSKGINSLGVKAHADILRLVATLLVLQLMRVEKLEEGELLCTLFCLNDSQPRPERWEKVKKAVEWVCWGDKQYPCVYTRLEFGLSWESSTRQLLGYEGLPPFSPLCGLNLQGTAHSKGPSYNLSEIQTSV